MSNSLSLDRARRDEILAEAASKRIPVTLSCHSHGNWTTLKSRILAVEGPGQRIVAEYPVGPEGQRAPDIERGQCVGISFRRGHKKCVFSSVVSEKRRFQVDQRNQVGALVIRWPEDICQLQRRAYFRVPVPAGHLVAVYLWPGGAVARQRAGSPGWPLHVGQLVDLSAGGFRAELVGGDDPQFSVGQTVGMEFVPEPNRPPVVVDAHFRHSEPVGQERISLGFQFVGLEQNRRSRELLVRLGQIAARWRHSHLGGGRPQPK
jgi:c-di-GMP-binding flagellar brake protein YcgR